MEALYVHLSFERDHRLWALLPPLSLSKGYRIYLTICGNAGVLIAG